VSEAEMRELREENARLWAENNRLRAERAEDDYHRRLGAHMQGSISWQVTAPLRGAKTLYVKVRRRLDETGG
jgi:hypothetical protein